METKGFKLQTKNLVLVPTNDTQLWTKSWNINKKENGTNVGKLTFKGNPQDYAVELEVTIKSEFKSRDYDREVLETISNWALGKTDVFFVEMYPYAEDRIAIAALEKAKFVRDENIGKKTRYIKKRDKIAWMIVSLSMFISGGFAIGYTIHDAVQGLIIGVCMGLVFGAFLTHKRNKRFKAAEEAWRASKNGNRGKRDRSKK